MQWVPPEEPLGSGKFSPCLPEGWAGSVFPRLKETDLRDYRLKDTLCTISYLKLAVLSSGAPGAGSMLRGSALAQMYWDFRVPDRCLQLYPVVLTKDKVPLFWGQFCPRSSSNYEEGGSRD